MIDYCLQLGSGCMARGYFPYVLGFDLISAFAIIVFRIVRPSAVKRRGGK